MSSTTISTSKEEGIEILLEHLKKDPENVEVLLKVANHYYDSEESEAAIETYKKLVVLMPDDAEILSQLGLCYGYVGDFFNAIEVFEKALKIEPEDSLLLSFLADSYSYVDEYNKAIFLFNKALEINPEETYALDSLGIIYEELGQDIEAERCYRKAIEADPTYAYAVKHLSSLLADRGEYVVAKELLTKTIDLFDSDDDYRRSLIQKELKDIDEKLEAIEATKNEDTGDKAFQLITLTKSRGIESKVFDGQRSFMKFIEEKTVASETNYFTILRRWNSYTPIIADNHYISKGGGYFLKANGKGIVIDPGFNFIDNFKGSGHHFSEINSILITHSHNDHTADLESILTLLHKYNELIIGLDDRYRENTILSELSKKRKVNVDDIPEEDVEHAFLASKRRKVVDIYLTKSTLLKYSGMFDLFSGNDYRLHVVEAGDVRELQPSLKMTVMPAKHNDIISDRDSVGFILDIDNTAIIYTGDTGWSDSIAKAYSAMNRKLRGKYKLLVAHLGGFKRYEENYLLPSIRGRSYYKNHLGRIGLVKINEILKPDVCLLSEFGEELKEYRCELANIFNEVFNGVTTFIPADIGLTFNLLENKFKTIHEISVENAHIEFGLSTPSQIGTQMCRKDYSLHYHDRSNNINIGDLVHVLGERFDSSRVGTRYQKETEICPFGEANSY